MMPETKRRTYGYRIFRPKTFRMLSARILEAETKQKKKKNSASFPDLSREKQNSMNFWRALVREAASIRDGESLLEVLSEWCEFEEKRDNDEDGHPFWSRTRLYKRTRLATHND